MRWYVVSVSGKNVPMREKSDEHARRRVHRIVGKFLAEAVANGAVAGEVSGAKLFRAGRERPKGVKEGFLEIETSVDVI